MIGPERSFRILIIGAGAIGCFVGGRLAAAGYDVTLVGRARTVAAVRARGLELRTAAAAPQTIRSVTAVASVQEAFHIEKICASHSDGATSHLPKASGSCGKAEPPFTLTVLAVKSYDTETALDELAAAVTAEAAPPAAILSLQNGVGNEEAIAARFGPERVIAGTITAPVEVREAGVVQVTKPKFAIGLANWRGSAQKAFLSRLQQTIATAGIPTKIYGDAQGMKWSKLLLNMIGNATSAILVKPPGVAFADPRIANLEIDALQEALRVMAAANIRPMNVEKYPLGALALLLRRGPRALLRPALRWGVGRARGGKMPSLFLDLEAGKSESEVSWYNGAIVSKGSEVGIKTPINRLLTRTVQQLAVEPQLRAEWRGNFERLAAAHSETRPDQHNQHKRQD